VLPQGVPADESVRVYATNRPKPELTESALGDEGRQDPGMRTLATPNSDYAFVLEVPPEADIEVGLEARYLKLMPQRISTTDSGRELVLEPWLAGWITVQLRLPPDTDGAELVGRSAVLEDWNTPIGYTGQHPGRGTQLIITEDLTLELHGVNTLPPRNENILHHLALSCDLPHLDQVLLQLGDLPRTGPGEHNIIEVPLKPRNER